MRELPTPSLLGAWCEQWLGAEPTDVLFHQGHLSQVMGLRLADGSAVVIKLRPPGTRLSACVVVQRHLWAAGFPCPEPLAGPAPLGALSATARYVAAHPGAFTAVGGVGSRPTRDLAGAGRH